MAIENYKYIRCLHTMRKKSIVSIISTVALGVLGLGYLSCMLGNPEKKSSVKTPLCTGPGSKPPSSERCSHSDAQRPAGESSTANESAEGNPRTDDTCKKAGASKLQYYCSKRSGTKGGDAKADLSPDACNLKDEPLPTCEPGPVQSASSTAGPCEEPGLASEAEPTSTLSHIDELPTVSDVKKADLSSVENMSENESTSTKLKPDLHASTPGNAGKNLFLKELTGRMAQNALKDKGTKPVDDKSGGNFGPYHNRHDLSDAIITIGRHKAYMGRARRKFAQKAVDEKRKKVLGLSDNANQKCLK